ncbi:hypothetical protein POM88_022076 [Heracleum sosnowskyi]|uniref:Uncharacterized protein n=1 Tax=Heracleum sosnowskyi TaxID=360622 RepID=A0AAD8IG59_9APIA|nr:hypothetical protein POM88_022076 [Heracleum sosnowskyi]
MLAIIFDHGLHTESETEAKVVQSRVLNMGIRCEIGHVGWPNGKPKQGHVQEAAGAVRQSCFILRLSRNSGVLGLAGMAFICQVFNTNLNFIVRGSNRILLVGPMLEFTKDDMYKMYISVKICHYYSISISQNLFLSYLSSLYGYAVVHLEILNTKEINNLCLSTFVTLLLKFISQRHRLVRGSALKQVMDYVRTYPCKVSSPSSLYLTTLFKLHLEIRSSKRVSTSLANSLHSNQIGYYMNRFLLQWKLTKNFPIKTYSLEKDGQGQGSGETVHHYYCKYCLVGLIWNLKFATWLIPIGLYLAELFKCHDVKDFLDKQLLEMEMCKETESVDTCSECERSSAERALLSLKSITVAARRDLPVLVHPQGLLLSIPVC